MEQVQDKFEAWAVIDLFGHAHIAGKVSEATIGGCSFLRVDVPAVKDEHGELQAFTKFFGQGAIYSMAVVTEQVARSAVLAYRVQPVTAFELRPALGHAQGKLGYGRDDDPGDIF